MNWSMVWEVVNSPLGYTVCAAVLGWILKQIYKKNPGWQKYEGTIIAAVRYAEKEIPDDTENKALARLDAALNYVLKLFPDADPVEVGEGISIVHNALEGQGKL